MQDFVRPQPIVLGAPGVEAVLLRVLGRFRRPGAFGFERPMHPFMPPVLLRRGGLAEIRQDPEAQPPHRERGEPPEGLGREGHAVVQGIRTGSPYSSKARTKTGRLSTPRVLVRA